ncbi:MAG TPA: hypothetical protein VH277_14305 [Gemmatimonadaceae bacterium]|nr:hypothetical protein [Gemmatimonadaceae bacterium]
MAARAAPRRRYLVDTDLYIDALRSDEARRALGAFHDAFAPFLRLSAVVAQELRAGVPARAAPKLEADLFGPYERRGRLITPSYYGVEGSRLRPCRTDLARPMGRCAPQLRE